MKLADIAHPTTAQDLTAGQVIAFADDVCTVIGTEYLPSYFGGHNNGDAVALVTESPDGSQFTDYVSPVRIFTVLTLGA